MRVEQIEVLDELEGYCPYCSNIPFVGRTPVSVAANDYNRPLDVTESAVLVPTVGMLVPGYFLLVSRKHIGGFSCLDQKSLEEINTYISFISNILEPLFGRYLVFEHTGISGQPLRSGGACIKHAHFHLIPAADYLSDTIQRAFEWKAVASLDAISGLVDPYLYYRVAEHHHVAFEPNVPSQWIRRTAASILSTPRHWDWAIDQGKDELHDTISRLNSSGYLERKLT